jgi:8-oxo-dGTP pyrophosphatase MutT (NUDIX family)
MHNVAVATPEQYTHVRVFCLDAEGRVLLMKWRDPFDGHETWEPPGGGIEPGESPLDAARRELREETGIVAELRDRYVLAARDDRWKGEVRHRLEPCFFAAVGEADVVPEMPTAEEADTLVTWRFVRQADIGRLDAPVYPADPFGLICALVE